MNRTLSTGATVWAGADCQPRPGWLLVSGDRIAAAGTADQPPPAAGKVPDLPGQHLVPWLYRRAPASGPDRRGSRGTDGIGSPDLPAAVAAIRTAAVAN